MHFCTYSHQLYFINHRWWPTETHKRHCSVWPMCLKSPHQSMGRNTISTAWSRTNTTPQGSSSSRLARSWAGFLYSIMFCIGKTCLVRNNSLVAHQSQCRPNLIWPHLHLPFHTSDTWKRWWSPPAGGGREFVNHIVVLQSLTAHPPFACILKGAVIHHCASCQHKTLTKCKNDTQGLQVSSCDPATYERLNIGHWCIMQSSCGLIFRLATLNDHCCCPESSSVDVGSSGGQA